MAQLRPLSDHENVRFGKNSYDVRNWKVRTRADDDQEIGKVRDALLDENARTRFLDIDVKGGRRVLIPCGEVRVDPTDEVVRVPGMDRDRMNKVPEYDGRPESVTSEYSRSLSGAYDDAYADEDYYARSDYTNTRRTGTDERSSSGTLARLDEMDGVDVASDQPDPRGWDVVDAEGQKVGKVDHIIGDSGSMTARYLTVELEEDSGRGGQILLPVGHVDLDVDEERVIASALRRERIDQLPRYEGGKIDRDYERRLRRQYDESYADERLFEHPRYRSDPLDTEVARVQRAREREAGEVEVKVTKRGETENVRKPVVTHREQAEIERRSMSGRSNDETRR